LHFFLRRAPGVLAGGCLALLGMSAPAGAQQQPVANAQTPDLQEIVVTGSLIRRTDTELPSPVQVITSADITDTGYTSITDVLRNLPANGQGALSQSFGQAFGAGGSGVALRGLTVGATLTLIDSERMVAYPLNDDNQRSFVDVSAIPIDAVDTIEVLKDNGSALYGSDAIAGVVNIRLKKSFTGFSFTAEGGTTQHGDGTTEHIAGIAGIGDLDADGHNFYVAIDLRHVDAISSENRSAAFTQLNWSGLPDGVNTQLGAPGSPSIGGFPRSLTGYLVNPGVAGPATAYLPGCTAALQAAGQCTFQFPGDIQPPTRQADILAKFSQKLADDWTFVVTGSVFDSTSQQIAPPFPPGNDCCYDTGYVQGGIVTTGFGPTVPPHVTAYPIITVPANYPGNPYGVAAPLIYTFGDIGPVTNYIDTVTYRLMLDLHGKLAGWDVTADAGAMYSSTSLIQQGDIEPALLQADINNGSYTPGVSTNGAQLFAPPASYHPSSTLDIVDIHATRELFPLPGGAVALGVGYQYLEKATNANPEQSEPLLVSGAQTGDPFFTVGAQADNAAFLQLQATAFKSLEVDASGRFDHYDTYGSSATPALGLKWSPIDMVTLRGTWGRGFRAPSTSESGTSGESFGAGQFSDPVLCKNGLNAVGSFNAECAFSLLAYQPSNPNLKAVKSLNETIGVLFEPSKNFNVSVDWWSIRLTDDIISQFEAGGLNDYTSLVRVAYANLPECVGPPLTAGGTCQQATVRTPVPLIAFANYPYVNAGITQTEGLDIDLRSHFDLGTFGDLKADLSYTHVFEYNLTVNGTTYALSGTHGPAGVSGDTGNPKDRAQLSLTWQKGSGQVTITENWIGPFSITDPSSGLTNCATSLEFYGPTAYAPRYTGPISGAPPAAWYPYCTVQRYFQTNLYAQYMVDDHLNLHGSIINIANNLPPVDVNTYGGGGQLAYDGAFYQDGAVGRFFMAGFTYKF